MYVYVCKMQYCALKLEKELEKEIQLLDKQLVSET